MTNPWMKDKFEDEGQVGGWMTSSWVDDKFVDG
jgi:hypothetical protein